MNIMQGHLETTGHTITPVDMVRWTSTKAVETAATEAERGIVMAVPETHRTGASTVPGLIVKAFVWESHCTRIIAWSQCDAGQ